MCEQKIIESFNIYVGCCMWCNRANIYYSQTIILVISHTLNMPLKSSGFIVSITQLGYGDGTHIFSSPCG